MGFYVNTGYGGTAAWKKLEAGVESAVFTRRSIIYRDCYLNSVSPFTEKLRTESELKLTGHVCGDAAVSYLLTAGSAAGSGAESELVYFQQDSVSGNSVTAKKVRVIIGTDRHAVLPDGEKYVITLTFSGAEIDTVFIIGNGVNGSEQQNS